MKILQIVQGFPPESIAGTELYCQALTRALQERGHDCLVLAGSTQQAKEPVLVTTDEEGIRVTRYVTPLPLEWRERQVDPYSPEAELLVRQHLETVRPDLIHVHHWLRLTNTVVSTASQLGIPAIVTLHDLWTSCARLHRQHRLGHFCGESPSPSLCESCVDRYPWQGDAEIRQAIELRQAQIAEELRLARCLLVPSETHRQLLSALLGFPPARLRVIPHGSIVRLSPHTDNERLRFPHRPLRLVYWGYLVSFKGVHLLLEAARQLKDRSAIEVLLVGPAPDARYFEYLQGLAEGLSVKFMGEYRHTDLASLDVGMAVFPSLAYESYGFVLDEAFQLGLPVIVSDRGALPTRIGEAGLVFAAGDAGALAGRIQEILDTPSLFEDMRKNLPSCLSPSMMEHAQALETIYLQVGQLSSHPNEGLNTVFSTAPRRLAYFQTALAARDQEILHLKRDLAQQATVLGHQKEEVSRLDTRLQEEMAKTRRLEVWIDEVSSSLGWRFLQDFYRVKGRLIAPPGTRRGRLYDLLKRTGMAYAEGGLARIFKKVRRQLDHVITQNPYQQWLEQHALTAERIRQLREGVHALVYQPKISIVMPVYNTEETWLRKAIESVRNQIYPNWELCICDDGSTASHVRRLLESFAQSDGRIKVAFSPHNEGVSSASNKALALASGEYVALLDHDDELMPHALCEVAKSLDINRAEVMYTDEAIVDEKGHATFIYFRPQFSPDFLASHQYIVHLIVVRKELLERIGGWDEQFEVSQDHDLLLRLMDATNNFVHVPQVLYLWRFHSHRHSLRRKDLVAHFSKMALEKHLERQGVAGRVQDTPFFNVYRIRRRIANERISIIIPTRNEVEVLRMCITSIENKSSYGNYEIIIVNNNSDDPKTLQYLAGLPYRVIRYDHPFNYSAINNVAASVATGKHLLFLNNDTEVINDDWLQCLLEHSQRREVGVVGAKLFFPNGRVQHGGVVLGLGGHLADHAFRFAERGDPGYLSSLVCVRNYSAVTGACMMVRSEVFHKLGGFDEEIKVVYSDVDLCLRAWREGYRVVWTPYALLYHHEAKTRKEIAPKEDLTIFLGHWGHFLKPTDPFYNPNLSLHRFDFFPHF